MNKIQEKIKIFCKKYKLSTPIEYKILDTMSELGELSKEILRSSDYGKNKIELNHKIKLELGDVLFSLITIANSLDVDLNKSLNEVLEKYIERIKKGSSPDSNND